MSNRYYETGSSLKAKNLAASRHGVDFPRWAVALLSLSDAPSVLDVGCGWGRFSIPLLELAGSRPVTLTCVDIWPGMVASCRQTLSEAGLSARFSAADARQLPFRADSFDLVMANHMLYELDDVRAAARELARVTRPEGQLLATTYADSVRVPLLDFHRDALMSLGITPATEAPSTFSLENGADILAAVFETVDTHVLDDVTELGDAGPLLDVYLKTGRYEAAARDSAIPAEVRAAIPGAFRKQAEHELSARGVIRTEARWTAFIAREPRS